MTRHRAEPPRRRAVPPAGHRRATPMRPRYGRLAVLGAAVSVTGIAMLGGVGVLPSVATGAGASDDPAGGNGTSADSVLAVVAASTHPSTPPQPATPSSTQSSPPAGTDTAQDDVSDDDRASLDPAVPADSGHGKRIVFDQSDQRVWLVDDDETVARTYLVSGSLYDNLDPGTYSVYSRSEHAWGVDDSGTMRYFVRFTEGDAGGAIGFHDIPVDHGTPVQDVDQLGTPQSHGCIRQQTSDAIALWDFAPIGTEVDVTA